jgi:hypothetical protein
MAKNPGYISGIAYPGGKRLQLVFGWARVGSGYMALDRASETQAVPLSFKKARAARLAFGEVRRKRPVFRKVIALLHVAFNLIVRQMPYVIHSRTPEYKNAHIETNSDVSFSRRAFPFILA